MECYSIEYQKMIHRRKKRFDYDNEKLSIEC